MVVVKGHDALPPLQAGEATVEEVFFGADNACYARILYRMDPPAEVVEAWRKLKAERWIKDLLAADMLHDKPLTEALPPKGQQ